MKRWYIILLSIFAFSFLFSCKESASDRITRLVTEWDNRKIIYPNKMYFTIFGRDTVQTGIMNSKYSIITYVDSVGCTSCKLALNRWLKFIAELDTITESSVPVHFFLNSSNKDEVVEIFERNQFDYPVCLDENDSINILNNFPKDIFFQTFLLDKDNRVIAIGNPVLNPKIKDLYFDIISENEAFTSIYKQILTTVSLSKDKIDFGDFSWDKRKEVEVVVINTGKVPLVINDVITSCGCTTVEYSKEPIQLGKNLNLKIKYQADHPEHFNKTITVFCNAEGSPFRLVISGNAK